MGGQGGRGVLAHLANGVLAGHLLPLSEQEEKPGGQACGVLPALREEMESLSQ